MKPNPYPNPNPVPVLPPAGKLVIIPTQRQDEISALLNGLLAALSMLMKCAAHASVLATSEKGSIDFIRLFFFMEVFRVDFLGKLH